MDPYVEPHLRWRALSNTDVPELVALRDQLDSFDDAVIPAVERVVGLDDTSTLATEAVGGWDAYGSLLAYGRNVPDTSTGMPRVFLVGGVHPAHRWMGIGSSLLTWQEARAREWAAEAQRDGPVWLGCFVEDDQLGLRRILEGRGFADERHYFDMYRTLGDLPRPTDVDGVEFVVFRPDRSGEVRDLHNLCFASDAGAHFVEEGPWEASLRTDTFRPGWSWLALVGDQVVGYALSGIDIAAEFDGVTAGWTDRVGVHPDHRGCGISVGLLQRALASMSASGCSAAGIGVDSIDPTSSLSLHGLLEYEARDAVVLMSKLVTP